MAVTPVGNPYVESSDLVANYPGVSETLAERLDVVGVNPFADSAARATAIPSPVEGQMASLNDDDKVYRYSGSAWVAVGLPPGLNPVTPTSIANSGGSASTTGNTTTFTTVTALSLNGVFTSAYRNYRIVIEATGSSTNLNFRMRAAGTDNSGANYARQYMFGSGASVLAARATGATSAWFISLASNYRAIGTYDISNPAQALQTSMVGSQAYSASTVEVITWANNHNQATAYDGITFIPDSGSFTGTVNIYGYNQ